MRCMLALLVVGCGDREVKQAPPPPIAAHDAAATGMTTRALDADLWDIAPVAGDAAPKPKSLCTELDHVAVGKAIGLAGPFVEFSNYQLGGPAWGTPGVRVCDWTEPFSFRGFGVAIDAEAKIDTSPSKDPASTLHIEWRPYTGLGTPAAMGYRPNVVTLQTVTHNASIEVEVVELDIDRADGERRAVLAMRAVLAQLPADATEWIAAPPAPPSFRNIPPIR